VLAGAAWQREQRFGPLARGLARAIVLALALGVGSMLLYAPFFDHYHAFVSGVGLVRDNTPTYKYLLLYGLFAAVLLPTIIGGAWRVLAWLGAPRRRLRIEAQNPNTSHPDTHAAPSPALKRIVLATTGYIAAGKVLKRRHVPILSPLVGFASFLVFLGSLLPALPVAARHVWGIWRQDRRPWVAASALSAPAVPSTIETPEGDNTTAAAPDHPREPLALRVRVSSKSSCLGQIASINGRLLLLLALVALLPLAWQQPDVGLRLWLGALIVVGGGVLLLARRAAPTTWYTLLLATLGWAVSLGIEFLFIRDHLAGGDYYRMNTVFKFGYQIWTLLALAAAASLPLVLRQLHRLGQTITRWIFPPAAHSFPDNAESLESTASEQNEQRRRQHLGGLIAQGAGLLLLAPLLAIALLFVLVGTPSRLANRFDPRAAPTLDGMAFMDYATFTHEGQRVNLRPDGKAIAWINENIVGTPVLAQSGLWFYRTYGIRVAANTGLPTIVSALHENEQRDPSIVGIRDSDIQTLFRTPDPVIAEQILQKYRVNYVYVGSIEHAFYPEEGINKFEAMRGSSLNLVYYTPGVQIYRVRHTPYLYPEPAPFFDTPDGKLPTVVLPLPTPPDENEVQQLDLRALENLFAADPSDNITAIELARRYAQMGRHNKSVEVLQKASNYHPEDIYLHHVWGDMLVHLGRYDEAEEVYRYAAATRPTSFNWYKLGSELFSWGRLDDGEEMLLKALDFEPVEPAAHYTLGRLYEQQGKTSQAINHMRRYLDLAPDGIFRAEAQQFLERENSTNGN
jgi:tetratricopeptide (TPR) repeat protein